MKQFGIRITLPEESTMAKNHLLGEDWESYRWYSTAQARDLAYQDMMSQPSNYREGDTIQQVLHKIERTGNDA